LNQLIAGALLALSVPAFAVSGDVSWEDNQAAFKVIQANSDIFSEICLYWYGSDAEGNILPGGSHAAHDAEDLALLSYLKKHHIKAVGAFAQSDGADSEENLSAVLNDPAKLKKHIAAITAVVVSRGFDGADIDYENISEKDKDAFSNFIKLLAESLHSQGKNLTLSVDVVASTADAHEWETILAEDLSALGKYADQLRLMSYDQHEVSSGPGPVASIPWFDQVLTHTLSLVPASKLIYGLPLYGYDWGQTGDETWKVQSLGYPQLESLRKTLGVNRERDDESKIPYFKYLKDGISHEAWYEDAISTRNKIDYVSKRFPKLGAFVWKLTSEDPATWNIFRSLKKLP
jgi:spore germination protein